MSEKMKEALSHGLVALLMGLGLTLPLLGMLELMDWAWAAAGLLAGLTVLLTAASFHKAGRIAALALLAGGSVVYLAALGGISVVAQVARALLLQLSGQGAALPLFGLEAALLLTFILGLAAWGMTLRSLGCYPAVAVVLLVAMMLWLSGSERLLLALLPALAATLALGVLSVHEELPLRRILPVALAAVLLAFAITPAGGVTIGPLKQAADDLRQRIYDYFFFTEQRSVFSLASEGYYPQGQNQLGGKAEPTDHPVMVVATPRRTYLRGVVKNEYTGRTWLNTTGGRRYLWVSPRWSEQRTALFDMGLPSGRLGESNGLISEQTVRVQMLSDNASNLFVPQRVRTLSPGGDLVPYFNNVSEVFATRDLQAGDTYTVTAPLMIAGDAGLGTIIDACARTSDPAYDAILQEYTQLPDHLQSMVYDLAREVVSGIDSPYEQAFALQNYLSRNFHYTLDVAEQPSDLDFVTNFLFNTEEGYCTYFASAMTVLCRMIGLPARYVEGYLATPDETGLAYVTGLQGHAWTEVYFYGFGWLTFDATPAQANAVAPPQNDPDDGADEPEPTPTPTPEPDDAALPENEPTPTPSPTPDPQSEDVATPEPTPPDEAPNQDQDPPDDPTPPSLWWLWLLLVLAVIAALAARIFLTQPGRLAARARTPEEAFEAWVQAVRDALGVMKLPPVPSESPMAYTRRLDGLHRLPVALAPLGRLMANVYYGKLTPVPEEIAQAQGVWQALFAALPPVRKAQVQLLRAFRRPPKGWLRKRLPARRKRAGRPRP